MKVILLWVLLAGLALSLSGCSGGCGRRGGPKETGGTGAAAPAVKEPSVTRALWVRDHAVISEAIPRTELMDFCRKNKINTLYLSLTEFPDRQYDAEFITNLKTLVRVAHASGMVIHAVYESDDRARLARRDNQFEAISLVRDFLRFNHAQSAPERFDGFLETLQPQVLPEWNENQDGVQESFADLVLEYRRTVLEFDPDLPLGWALPVSFDALAWLPRVYENLNYVVLLDYVDDADRIAQNAAGELALAGEKGVKVVVGVDTTDEVGQGEGSNQNTYFEEGADRLEADLKRVSSALKTSPAFAGVAIHDYESFKILPDSPP